MTESESTAQDTTDLTLIDPRAPRFGQIITGTVLTIGIILQEPFFVLAIGVIFVVSVLSRWRFDLYSFLWRYGMISFLGKPDEKEPAAPHRFAKLLGASFTVIATALLFAAPVVSIPGLALAGYAVAGLVAILAAIGGVGDYCLGCKMYNQISFFRRLGVV